MISIKKFVRITIISFIAIIIGEALVIQYLTSNTKINGEVYKQISSHKDLIADVLPPPAYIVEAHFVVTSALTTVQAGSDGKSPEMQRLLKEAGRLKTELEERQAYWQNNPYISSELQKLIVNDASKVALKYFEVLNAEFIPAAVANNVAASNAAYGKLNSLFEEQKSAVIKVVDLASKSVVEDEKLAVSVNTSAMWSVFVLILILVVLLLAVQYYIYKKSIAPLSHIASDISHGADQSFIAANQVAQASQQLAEGASEQAASVQETSASLEEISSMIHSTANNAMQAKALANEAQQAAREGIANMDEMTRAMAAIEKSSYEVAKIVKSIDEIAFQTNILALNAAVEAARAGEAGAGFAVVADEVRSLAQRSAAAAHESADKIDASIQNSRDGSKCLLRVNDSFINIEKKVHQTDSLVAEIALAAKEQALGIEHIGMALEQMSQVTNSNSLNAEVSASAAEEMSGQAGVNRDLTNQLFMLVDGSTLKSSGKRPDSEDAKNFENPPVTYAVPALSRGNSRSNHSPKLKPPHMASSDRHFKEF